MILFVLIGEFISKFLNVNSENTLSGGFISAGMGLVSSSFPSTLDNLMNLFGRSLGEQWSTEAVNIWSLIIGIMFIVLGVFLLFYIKDRIFILNMFGLFSQFEISEEQNVRDLKLNDFKVKEIIIDFVDVFKSGIINDVISEKSNNMIVNKIKNDCLKFKNRSKEFRSCFTGMAPIPYTMLAGTYLADSKLERYFEYERGKNRYYEVMEKTKGDNYESLLVDYPQVPKLDSKDVLVAISITRKINKNQMKEFGNIDVIEIYLPHPDDNIIRSKKQLNEYKKQIICSLEDIGVKYGALNRIHLISSIPSCMSVEIGKAIALNNNRLKQIIAYHYVAQGNKKYPFGIILTENTLNDEHGKLVKN